MSAWSDAVAALSPQLWWRLDETGSPSTAADSGSAGATATVQGSPTFEVTPAGTLDGGAVSGFSTSNRIFVNNPWSGQTRTGYTLGALVRSTSTGLQSIIGADTAQIARRLFQFRMSSGKLNLIHFTTGGGSNSQVTSSGDINDGDWHLVVATWDGSTLRLYIDGALDGSKGESAMTSTSNTPFTWGIGSRPNGSSSTTYGEPWSNGAIDEVFVLTSALSGAQISDLWDAVTASSAGGVAVDPPAATATAATPVPSIDISGGPVTLDPPAATATATAPVPTVDIGLPPATPPVIERKLAVRDDFSTTPSVVSFAQAVEAGDVVLIFCSQYDRNAPTWTVSGLGATWSSVERFDSSTFVSTPAVEVFKGVAVTDGDVTITPSTAWSTGYYAILLRDVSSTTVAATAYIENTAATIDGPTQTADDGQVVATFGAIRSHVLNGWDLFESYTPASGWLTETPATGDGSLGGAVRVPGSSQSHEVSDAGSGNAYYRIVQVVIGDAVVGPVSLDPPAATATAAAPVPTIGISSPGGLNLTPPAATATAEALAPEVTGVSVPDAAEFYPFRSRARMGYLTIPIPLPPPAHVDPVKVARYSHVAPALSEANPILTEGVDYPHADAVDEGTWHVFVGGVDVTYLGGAPIQNTRRSSRSPMGDVSATFEIPAMQAWTEPGEGDLYMLQPDAPVDMVLVDDLGNQTHLWRGFLSSVTSSVDATSETPTKSHTFIADGTLWQAGYTLHEPPHYLPPTDIGTLIPDALNKVPGKRWNDIPRVTTGRLSRNRGSGNQSVMQWVDELLQKDGLEDNGGQWTLVESAPGEFRLQLKPETTSYDYTVTYGAFGIEVDLTRDESMRVDVIYGRGIETNGGQWRGTRFPGLVIATPPPYPNDPPTSLHLGDSDADTDSGDGISVWQGRMIELGYTLTRDGTLNANDIQVVRRLQARMGALVDGVIGPQTWAASFNRGPEGIDLTQWREPIAALDWTQEFYRDPSGIILSENPDYDPTRVQHQIEVDFGVNITWREAQPLAERMLEIESMPALTGTIRMVTDFHEAWRGLAKPGDRVRIVGFHGADVIVRVAAVDVSVGDDGMEVVLTVDERSRDAYNVEAILERNRDALPDPNRRPGSPSRASRLVQDRFVQWDIDSPCGFMPRTAVFGGLWVAPNPIPFAEVGRVVKTLLTSTVPFTLALMALPTKPSQMHAIVGDPHTQDSPWEGEARVAALDALGWIISWGSQGERCGYSPNGQESNGATFTGRFEEYGGFDFISGRPPYVWPLLFSSTTGFIGGAEAGGWGRFYPDTSV